MKKIFSQNTINWLVLLGLSLAWGSSFSVRLEALQTYSESQVAFFQILGATLFFIPFILKSVKKINKQNIPLLFLSGFLGNVLTSIFYALGQSRLDVSIASILSALVPIVVFVGGIIFMKQRFSIKAFFAILLGLLGVVILIFGDSLMATNTTVIEQTTTLANQTTLWGICFILLAVIAGASNIVLIGFAFPKLNGTEIASLAFLLIAPLPLIGLFTTDFTGIVENPKFTSSTLTMILLAFISFIGTLGFNELIKRSSPLFASLSTYLILLIGVLMGVIFSGDTFSMKHILAIICIFMGVYWINQPEKKPEN